MNNIDKKFENLVNQIKLFSLDDIFNIIKRNLLFIPKKTLHSLENYLCNVNYWGTLNVEKNDFTEVYEKAKSLKEHIDDYVWLYNSLNDYKSKTLLYGILNNWYRYDFTTLDIASEKTYKHYFDLDIIPNCKDEVIADLGAYVGDTTLDFIETYGKESYNKIYCYEITDSTFSILKTNLFEYKNIIYKNLGVSDKEGILYLNAKEDLSSNQITTNGNKEVKTTSLDIDISEPLTMIKMDIEGAEQSAILGCKSHIINDNPKLLISVYHNNEDLWKIPRMIHSINSNYNYYLRYYGGCIFPTEIVFFAIPKK